LYILLSIHLNLCTSVLFLSTMWNNVQEDPGMLGEPSMNMNAHE